MFSYKVTDEGGGIIRVDAQTRLMRKPMAQVLCDEVDTAVADYDEFKILMNMSAMSKGTPAAGLYVLRSMKKYPLRALALYGANGFMRGMARTVLGLARFANFELFDDEAEARSWLERGGHPGPAGAASPSAGAPPQGLRRLAVPVGLGAAALVLRRAGRRRRAREGVSVSG